MDPNACMQRILELTAVLEQKGKTNEQLVNNDDYIEWEECWGNLVDWLMKGGFPPTLDSLELAGKQKRRVHGSPITKYEWIDRIGLTGPVSLNRRCTIHSVELNSTKGPYEIQIYNPSTHDVEKRIEFPTS